ncbi:hypothetical protein TNCV_895531 [Trichonephila clavipes]|nr:hypothetical protein TNCV_895531 [Trichonephila clavipes]
MDICDPIEEVETDQAIEESTEIMLINQDSETTRVLLARNHGILNHGQVTWTTLSLPPSLTTSKHQLRRNILPTRRVLQSSNEARAMKEATYLPTWLYRYHLASRFSCHKL